MCVYVCVCVRVRVCTGGQHSVTWLLVVLKEEVRRFDRLLGAVRSSLLSICSAVKGETLMTEEMEELHNALLTMVLPAAWKVSQTLTHILTHTHARTDVHAESHTHTCTHTYTRAHTLTHRCMQRHTHTHSHNHSSHTHTQHVSFPAGPVV